MKDAELYSGVVSPEKQAEYERWLVERFGSGMEDHLQASRKRAAQMSKDDWHKAMQEADDIIAPIADGFRQGLPPQSLSLEPHIERHRDWISWAWGRPATPEAYAGLADVYLHPDFVARFDKAGPGFTQYLTTAMKAWANRQAS